MKSLLKRLIRSVAPGLYWRISIRRAIAHRKRGNERLDRIGKVVIDRLGSRVRAGPFAGLNYVSQAHGSVLIPKILGFYEREIHDWVNQAIGRNYVQFIDIGCAEGYYAVGFCHACPTARVIAYDIQDTARQLCRQLGDLNHVGARLDVRGECTHATLASDLQLAPSLVFCDCEGFEEVLLDPARCPPLAHTDMLVELHDFASPGLTERLLARFASTHDVRVTPAVGISPAEVPELEFLPEDEREAAVTEYRPPGMAWAYLIARRPPLA